MSENRDDDTTPDRQRPVDEGDSATDATQSDASRPDSVGSKEPLVSGDPLGLGGTTEPDAPSRHPRPKIVALLGEFFKMSRTTAILLAAFVLLGLLYAMVKDDPVVGIGTPAPSTDETSEVTPSEETTTGETSTGETSTGETSTGDPTSGETPTSETTVPTGTPRASTQETGTTQSQNRQTPTVVPDQTGQQAPQGTPQEQAQQQQAPGNGGAGTGGAGAGQELATTG